MKEVFKTIPNYDDYQVSNFGNVKSFKGVKERILKASLSGKGYPKVTLCLDDKQKTIKVHKLIQLVFELDDGFIDHKNGIRTDNRLENLRVVTIRENNQNKECHRNGQLVGASFMKARAHLPKPWQAYIRVNSKKKYLGHFKTELEAHQSYKTALDAIGGQNETF